MSDNSLIQIEVKPSHKLGRIITARTAPRETPFLVAFEHDGYWAVVDRRDDLPAVLVETEIAAMAIVDQLAAKAVNA